MFPQTPTPSQNSQPTHAEEDAGEGDGVANATHQPRGAFVSVTRQTLSLIE